MALKNGSSSTTRLVGVLLTPSSVSGSFAAFVGVITVGGTILVTRLGSATQQSLLGLHSVYNQSSLGVNTDAVGQQLSGNLVFNDIVLFVLWGSVGLVVYTIVQGLITEFKNTDDLLHEIHYVHADRQTVVRDAILRALTRLVALAVWWVLAWAMLHKVFPYAIAAAHLSAYHLASAGDWPQTLLGFCYCVLGVHGLTVLLRLILLRPRLTGNSILDN